MYTEISNFVNFDYCSIFILTVKTLSFILKSFKFSEFKEKYTKIRKYSIYKIRAKI